MKTLGLDWLGLLKNVGVRLVGFAHIGGYVWVPFVLGRDKLGIRALGSLVSSHKNESNRVLRTVGGRLYFSLRGYKTLGKFHSFFLSCYYMGPIGI